MGDREAGGGQCLQGRPLPSARSLLLLPGAGAPRDRGPGPGSHRPAVPWEGNSEAGAPARVPEGWVRSPHQVPPAHVAEAQMLALD